MKEHVRISPREQIDINSLRVAVNDQNELPSQFFEGSMRLHMVDSRPNETGSTIIIPRSYDAKLGDTIDDIEVQRDRAIAYMTGSRVVGVDVPGVGLNKAHRSTGEQKAGIIAGSYAPFAHAQLESVIQTADLQDGDPVRFVGYSMGAWAVTEMIKSMQQEEMSKKLKVGGVALIEATNDDHFPLLGKQGLLARIGEETNDENTNRYLAFNERFGFAQPRDRVADDYETKQKVDAGNGAILNLLIGVAMRNGFRDDLTNSIRDDGGDHVTGVSEVPVSITRTNGSTVAREMPNQITYEQLSNVNPNTQQFGLYQDGSEGDTEPHQHPIWQSIGHSAAIATILDDKMYR